MHTIELEHKGKDEIHVVLHPGDISNLLTVLKVNRHVMLKDPPWDTAEATTGALQITDWLSDLVTKTHQQGLSPKR